MSCVPSILVRNGLFSGFVRELHLDLSCGFSQNETSRRFRLKWLSKKDRWLLLTRIAEWNPMKCSNLTDFSHSVLSANFTYLAQGFRFVPQRFSLF